MIHDWLFTRCKQFGRQPAIVGPAETCAYDQLWERAERWRADLEQLGLAAGQCVALQGTFSAGTLSLLAALIAGRQIAVPLPTTLAPADAERWAAQAGAALLFAFDETDEAQPRVIPGVARPPLLAEFCARREAGLVLFSSGSTGSTKAALHSLPRLLERHAHAPGTARRTLAFLSLDHIGGINTLLHVLSCGGTLVAPAARTPDAVAAAIAQHHVQLLPTTPTFLRMLLMAQAHVRHDLSALELITYGTEPMPPATLTALRAALPGVRLKQTYGLTETGILPTRSGDSGSLWMDVGGRGYETKVVDGRLWIRSPAAMVGYLNAPSPFDAQGWLPTDDVVECHAGRLRIVGRGGEMINVGGEKVCPGDVENVIADLDNIRDVVVSGRRNPITGRIVVATVELLAAEDAGSLERRVRQHCQARLAPHQVPAVVRIADAPLCGARFKKTRSVEASP